MATTTINIRIDEELKKSAELLFDDLGLTMSAAITIFLKSSVNNEGIPFELKRAGISKKTEAAIAEYIDMQMNSQKYKRYDTAEELLAEAIADA